MNTLSRYSIKWLVGVSLGLVAVLGVERAVGLPICFLVWSWWWLAHVPHPQWKLLTGLWLASWVAAVYHLPLAVGWAVLMVGSWLVAGWLPVGKRLVARFGLALAVSLVSLLAFMHWQLTSVSLVASVVSLLVAIFSSRGWLWWEHQGPGVLKIQLRYPLRREK